MQPSLTNGYPMIAQDQFTTLLGFTPEDLSANRSGSLTTSQRERMHSLRRRELFGNVILGPIFIMVPIAVIIAAAYLVLRNVYSGLEWMWLVLLAGVVINIIRFIPNGLQRWRAVGADIENGEAVATEGRAAVKSTRYRRATAYTLKIGDVSFDVPETITQVFQQGQVYRAYYTPQAMILLSAEKL